MTESDELDIRCLITEPAYCPYRSALRNHFGYVMSAKCSYRVILKKEFESYLDEEAQKIKIV